jgi:hypothetical protein
MKNIRSINSFIAIVGLCGYLLNFYTFKLYELRIFGDSYSYMVEPFQEQGTGLDRIINDGNGTLLSSICLAIFGLLLIALKKDSLVSIDASNNPASKTNSTDNNEVIDEENWKKASFALSLADALLKGATISGNKAEIEKATAAKNDARINAIRALKKSYTRGGYVKLERMFKLAELEREEEDRVKGMIFGDFNFKDFFLKHSHILSAISFACSAILIVIGKYQMVLPNYPKVETTLGLGFYLPIFCFLTCAFLLFSRISR